MQYIFKYFLTIGLKLRDSISHYDLSYGKEQRLEPRGATACSALDGADGWAQIPHHVSVNVKPLRDSLSTQRPTGFV
jgi:hypothetical protein